MKKIAIFIPGYNIGSTLPLVLDRIPEKIKRNVKEIFVVDNASPDNTYLSVIGYKEHKKLHNLSVIRNETNKGYGGSQKVAYNYAIKKGYDLVVMLHGDAQYAPEELPTLIEHIEKTNADLVFGSRMSGNPLKGGMPIWRFIGNKILTIFENFVLKTNLSEFHSGYRVYNCHALKKIPFNLCSNDYYFDTDILIQFKLANLKISEVPIPTHYGKESHSPTIRQTLKYSGGIIAAMVSYILHKQKIRRIKKFEVEN